MEKKKETKTEKGEIVREESATTANDCDSEVDDGDEVDDGEKG